MELTRRVFIRGIVAYSAVTLCGCTTSCNKPSVRFGMVADVHFADIAGRGKPHGVVGRRFYRESKRKMDEAVAVFNTRGLDFVIELGDFKDLSPTKDATLAHLDAIEKSFTAFRGPCYHAPGNHDFDCLTPEEFYSHLANAGEPMTNGYYSFDIGGIRFVVLDACYDSDLKHYSRNNPWDNANVPPEELAWLERTLADAKGAAVVFCHQRLDLLSEPRSMVRNAEAVRTIIERSGKVKTVITGHQHKGGIVEHNGVLYYSLRAMVCDSGEGANSFAEAAIAADGSLSVTGWRRAASHRAKGEFPERGMAVMGEWCGSAALVEFEATPRIEALDSVIAKCPRNGCLVSIHCTTAESALSAAQLLKRMGRLAQGIVLCDARETVERTMKECPWVRLGFACERLDRAAVQCAAEIGAELLRLPKGAKCDAAQTCFLHDHAIATVGFDDGSDFCFKTGE